MSGYFDWDASGKLKIQRNDFLTAIAKDYCRDFDAVYFCRLLDPCLGHAAQDRRTSRHEIYLDPRKFRCSYKLFFTLFHEMGHIVLNHFSVIPENKGKPERNFIEIEADNWALKQLGIESAGRPQRSLCDECVRFDRRECFLEISNRQQAAAGIAAGR